MKRVSLFLGIIVVGCYLIYGTFMIISNLKNYRLIDFFIVMIVWLLVLSLETFLIKKYSKVKYNNVHSTVLYENPIEVKVIKSEVSSVNQQQMHSSYTEMQLQGDLRILEDSISLMKSTKDLETFLSRSELAMRTSLTLEQAKNANISFQSNFLSSKEVMDLKFQLLPNVLDSAYLQMSSDAMKLKTAKGQLGRYQKFLYFLEENEYELDICDNYDDIVSLTQKDISNIQLNLSSN